jgi:hypothetical protein
VTSLRLKSIGKELEFQQMLLMRIPDRRWNMTSKRHNKHSRLIKKSLEKWREWRLKERH